MRLHVSTHCTEIIESAAGLTSISQDRYQRRAIEWVRAGGQVRGIDGGEDCCAGHHLPAKDSGKIGAHEEQLK